MRKIIGNRLFIYKIYIHFYNLRNNVANNKFIKA